MSKSEIRDFLIECKPCIKLNTFCKMVGLNQATLSLFMKSNNNDYMISHDKLMQLVALIKNYMYELVDNFA